MNERSTAQVITHPSVQQRVDQTKRHVCQVAARLFAANAFDRVSVETIIFEAGIARSTFYRWFNDKEDLLRQIMIPAFNDARDQLEQLDRERPEEIPNGVADSLLAVWEVHREAFLLTSSIGTANFHLVQSAHDAYAKVVLELMQILEQARMLRNDDALLASMFLAQLATRLLQTCESHPQFHNVFRSTLRGMLLKW